MAELKNLENELDRFRLRLIAAGAFVLLAFALLGARLSWLQVVRHEDLAAQAESNRTAVLPIVPNRGRILDRHGEVLATNYSAYTLEITPSLVDDVDATIDALSDVIEIGARDKRRFKRLREEGKSFESLPIRNKLSDEEVARFIAQRFRFPGVDVKARLFRNYPMGDTGSHLLGYIGRINQAEKAKMEDWPDGSWPTTRAPNTSASSAWSKATRPSCTARPASSASRRAPAAARCAACPAMRRRRATR